MKNPKLGAEHSLLMRTRFAEKFKGKGKTKYSRKLKHKNKGE